MSPSPRPSAAASDPSIKDLAMSLGDRRMPWSIRQLIIRQIADAPAAHVGPTANVVIGLLEAPSGYPQEAEELFFALGSLTTTNRPALTGLLPRLQPLLVQALRVPASHAEVMRANAALCLVDSLGPVAIGVRPLVQALADHPGIAVVLAEHAARLLVGCPADPTPDAPSARSRPGR